MAIKSRKPVKVPKNTPVEGSKQKRAAPRRGAVAGGAGGTGLAERSRPKRARGRAPLRAPAPRSQAPAKAPAKIASRRSAKKSLAPADLAKLPDDALLDAVQRQTFRYFWEGAHPASGLALDRRTDEEPSPEHRDKVALGGSGFGVMAMIVAAERGWVTRDAAVQRMHTILDALFKATSYHGVFPHFMNGNTGETIRFSRKDDGADLVETALLFMGLLCARQYFDRDNWPESAVRGRIGQLWDDVEWNWHTQDGREVLYWHWSPNNGWAMDHEIRGWNECLITYVLAASSRKYAIEPVVYHRGFAEGRGFLNGKQYYGIDLPLGLPYGGPLFFAHYSFCGLDPRGLRDRYADYGELNVRHVQINRAHCIANPNEHEGYGDSCWGLTASDDPEGYAAHAPDNDNGTISPTAALASMPYAPAEVLKVTRHLLTHHGAKLWGPFGFRDAFCERLGWYAGTYLAIDQGPIVVMMENHRTGLLWKLFMSVPEIQTGLRKLGFESPHLQAR